MAYFEFKQTVIKAMASAVPQNTIWVDSFEDEFGAERVEQLKGDYGISSLRKATPLQTTSDLGFAAIKSIFEKYSVSSDEIGLVIFASRTSDYRSPATACVLHGRLELTKDCLAYDINIGGAGFCYGLQLASGLLESSSKKYGILVIGDTVSKQLAKSDPLNMIMGDAASSILLEKKDQAFEIAVQMKTKSEKYKAFQLVAGGFRRHGKKTDQVKHLNIDKQELADLIDSEIPLLVQDFMKRRRKQLSDYDCLAFPQIGLTGVKTLANALNYPIEKIPTNFNRFGDTGSSSTPLILADHFKQSEKKRLSVLSIGLGEGLTWCIAEFTIASEALLPIIETEDAYQEGTVSRDF